MKCLQCKEEFEGRADAKFCSSKCRLIAHRNETDNEINVSSETDKSKVETDKPLSVSKPEENDTVKVSVSEKKVKTLKDFGYSLKDLGVKWAPEGGPIFLRNDITSQQTRDLVTVMFAMKGKKFQQSKSKTYEEVG